MANKDALRALQQRLADRLQQVRHQAPVRNWLAVEIAGHGFLLPLDQAGEIFPLSPIQPVPHSQPWFLGVANLRGQLHGVIDLAGFVGLPPRPVRAPGDGAVRDAGRLVAFSQGMQLNVALLVDRLLGLRNATTLSLTPQPDGAAPHFVGQQLADAQGQTWYELDLGALVADEAFMKIDV